MSDNVTRRRVFDAPLDAWYVWLGLALASGATFTVASAMPAAPPPDAAGAARTVDATAASEYAAVGEHPLRNAAAVKVGSDTLSLRGPGGTAHASLGYGPVTPAHDDERLLAVLRGSPPDERFGSVAAFEAALEEARESAPTWHRTDRLTVRRVSWEGIDAVLVA